MTLNRLRSCAGASQAAAALIKDLKQRGLLDTTLVIWGGEFGRTPMNEARNVRNSSAATHHPKAFSVWMTGGGTNPASWLGRRTS
jgi:hypothetical protein